MKRIGLTLIFVLMIVIGYNLRDHYVHADVYSPSLLDAEVFVIGGNGFGSGDSIARRFSTVEVNIGTAITYADDSVYGGSFLINVPGVYSISYTDWRTTASNSIYITSDGDAPASAPAGSDLKVLCSATTDPSHIASCSATMFLDKNDVVRATWWGGGGFSSPQPYNGDQASIFIITRVR